ncbi:MAG: phosphatase PAP2 family protein [Patescibacteria group bacterium]
MRSFIFHLEKNLVGCFSKYYLLWHLGAITLTYLLVATGFDWRFFVATRNPTLQSFLFPAAAIGGLVPLFGPLFFIALGSLIRNRKTIMSAVAVIQAELLGFIISGFYKVFTGRIQPPLHFTGQLLDDSGGFRFGILRGGVFWGWPSTHTTVAFAMAVTLYILYPRKRLFRYFLIAYAFYIGIGISTNIHWFSDGAAGAIIGTLIGEVVGRSFVKSEKYGLRHIFSSHTRK